jgi:hypothetical protein
MRYPFDLDAQVSPDLQVKNFLSFYVQQIVRYFLWHDSLDAGDIMFERFQAELAQKVEA